VEDFWQIWYCKILYSENQIRLRPPAINTTTAEYFKVLFFGDLDSLDRSLKPEGAKKIVHDYHTAITHLRDCDGDGD